MLRGTQARSAGRLCALGLSVRGRVWIGAWIVAAIIGWSASPGGGDVVGRGSDGPLRVVFFYTPTCGYCQKAKVAVSASEVRWGGLISVERLNVKDNERALAGMWQYEDCYGSDEQAVLKVFVGDTYIAGGKQIAESLDGVIEGQLTAGAVTFAPPPPGEDGTQGAMAAVLARFGDYSVATVVLGGLVDGINPCAFTTIVFLLSILNYLGKSRRQLAAVGLGFTAAVFATYFLLGLGLLGAVKVFSVSSGLARVMAWAVACLTFVLAGWNVVDFVRYKRTGDVNSATLGLPKALSGRIRRVIRVGLSTRHMLIGSMGVGVLVALLESLCTGQVYVPIVMVIQRSDELRTGAVGYLLLYNLMFITPLVVLLTLAYFGVRSQRLGAFLRNHLGAFKLAMAGVLVVLGLLVLATA